MAPSSLKNLCTDTFAVLLTFCADFTLLHLREVCSHISQLCAPAWEKRLLFGQTAPPLTSVTIKMSFYFVQCCKKHPTEELDGFAGPKQVVEFTLAPSKALDDAGEPTQHTDECPVQSVGGLCGYCASVSLKEHGPTTKNSGKATWTHCVPCSPIGLLRLRQKIGHTNHKCKLQWSKAEGNSALEVVVLCIEDVDVREADIPAVKGIVQKLLAQRELSGQHMVVATQHQKRGCFAPQWGGGSCYACLF
eukprot:TRINITY_DN86288_c0_g1_i1.p1 TRINITY_DN86288_c0_g1~~TRINITY_DN86288_c0_g1_i1.p1  ORF type:complete len:248 (+),score=10.69 TRINITY_DN86288_c0_g1_i1:55-798(+)